MYYKKNEVDRVARWKKKGTRNRNYRIAFDEVTRCSGTDVNDQPELDRLSILGKDDDRAA